MNIISVIPTQHTGPNSTIINATDKAGKRITYSYSHTYELLHDPNNPMHWAQWNGGSLTDALAWIILL